MSPASDGSRPAEVLFLCTANVCRSPMAEAIFDSLISGADLPWKARRSGVAAPAGEPIAPRAEAVLREPGVSTEGRRARRVGKTRPEEVDLVLVMTQQHTATSGRVFAGPSAKVHTLLGYVQAVTTMERIPDPNERSIAVHRATVRQILYHLRLIVEGLGGR